MFSLAPQKGVSAMTGPRPGVVCQGRCDDRRSGCGEWFWMVREVDVASTFELLVVNPSKHLAGSVDVSVAHCLAQPTDSFGSALVSALTSGRPLGLLISGVEVKRRGLWSYGGLLLVEINLWGLRRGVVPFPTLTGRDVGLLMRGFLNDAMGIPPIESKLVL